MVNVLEPIEETIIFNGFTLSEILYNDDVNYDKIVKLYQLKNIITINYVHDGNEYDYDIKIPE